MRAGASTFRAGTGATRRPPFALLAAAAALTGAAAAALPLGADGEAALGLPAAVRPAETGARPVRHGEMRRYLVRFEDVVRNGGDEPLRDLVCDALLPLDTDRQVLRWFRLSPHGWRLRTDSHGQRVATASIASLAPGECARFSWIASVEIAAEMHDPDARLAPPAAAAGRAPGLPDDVRRYLDDGPPFGLATDAVRCAADEVAAAAGARTPLDVVRAAADHVRSRVAYRRHGGWDAAPAVLGRGEGSCSETTFAFAAICRRLGVPVRWTGGTVLRAGPAGPAGRAIDTSFHRLAEAWIPGHGWLPVETSSEEAVAADAGGEGAAASGGPGAGSLRIPASLLQLAVGDGSGDAGAGVSYFVRDRWVEPPRPAGAPRAGFASRTAVWLPGVEDALARRGTLAGLEPDDLPSFSRAELLACDARRFGAPLDASGAPLRDAVPAVRPTLAEAASLLLAAAHPEGVRLALEASSAARDAVLEERLRATCDDALLAEALPLLGAPGARIEAWWDGAAARIVPLARGRLAFR